jgi:GNAT superfamily N-acetyltransferase
MEEVSNNAWPALQVLQYDGWLLRFAGGVTKRSNSVSLLYPSTITEEVKISFCESAYKEKGITPCFKITEVAKPTGIDQMLSERGYFIHSHISFQTLDLRKAKVLASEDTVIETKLNHGWIDDFIRMNGFDQHRKPVYEAIMQQVLTPKCLVSVKENEKRVAVGLGVLEDKFVGIFDLVVDPEKRRSGLARQVMAAILQWGKQQGAETAYLQVLTDNHAALTLYDSMGFSERYRYWYRMAGA